MILVTGGAGYIGSVTVELLRERGKQVVVLDNLSRGHRSAISLDIPFYGGNIGDRELVARIAREHKVEACIYFAALAYVGESVADPARYFENNVGQGIALLAALLEAKVSSVVFSSTCATYDEPQRIPISEDHPQQPTITQTIYNDAFDRPTQIKAALGTALENHTAMYYAPQTNPFVTLTSNDVLVAKDQASIDDRILRSWTHTDPFGRTFESWTSDPQGDVKVATGYDGLGRAVQTSNPFRPATETQYNTTTCHSERSLDQGSVVERPGGATALRIRPGRSSPKKKETVNRGWTTSSYALDPDFVVCSLPCVGDYLFVLFEFAIQ